MGKGSCCGITHPAALCLSTTAAVLTWDSWLYPSQESQGSRMKPQRYTLYVICLGFLLSNLRHFCSDLLLTIHAGSAGTCGHRGLCWATPCSPKPSHAPGRRGWTKRCRDEISQAYSSKAAFSHCSPKRLMMEKDSLKMFCSE